MRGLAWVMIAAGLSADVDWRRLGLLCLALAAPIPAGVTIGWHWWRQRPRMSMRAPRFCDAIVGELRSGASLRSAVGHAAASVDADDIARLCRLGAPMAGISGAARIEFPDIGDELAAVLARAERAGGSPVALFEEMSDLALAQIEVAHEVATSSAPGVATAAVLLLAPTAAVVVTANRGGFDRYLAQSGQRVAAMMGLALVIVGLAVSLSILRKAR